MCNLVLEGGVGCLRRWAFGCENWWMAFVVVSGGFLDLSGLCFVEFLYGGGFELLSSVGGCGCCGSVVVLLRHGGWAVVWHLRCFGSVCWVLWVLFCWGGVWLFTGVFILSSVFALFWDAVFV